jgi:hypothetical protein
MIRRMANNITEKETHFMDEVQQAEQALKRAQQKANAEARQVWLDKLAAAKAAKAAVEAKAAEVVRQKAERDLKQECLYRWTTAGGSESEFEKQWPSIRLERLKQLAAGTGAPSFVDDLVRRKRQSGAYGNL